MGRIRTLPLLLAVAVIASCTLVPTEAAREVLAPHSIYRTAEAAYRILLERHVDKPGSPQLLGGALDSVKAQLVKDKISDPIVDKPAFSGNVDTDFDRFAVAMDAVAAKYKDEKSDVLERAAVDGMAKSMNECHTYYLDPDRAKSFNQPPQQYSGIGAQISAVRANDLPEIAAVFPNSPAEKAGLRSGDRIKSVDGVEVAGFTAEEVANKIRGPEATTVTLVTVRGSTERTVPIVRATLRPPQVIERMLDNKVGYMSVAALNGDVTQQVTDTVNKLDAAGATTWILDLRNDPGGDLSVAVNVASIFMKGVTIVNQVGRDGQTQALRTNDRFFFAKQKPIVVLVNKNSASGAEIIAAGVQANGIGSVVGTKTAGCVGIGQPREMPDGGLLLVTIARMQDAKTGAELNGPSRGVVPDKVVDQAPDASSDMQLDAAIALVLSKVKAP